MDIDKLTSIEIEFLRITVNQMYRDFNNVARIIYPHVGSNAKIFISVKQAEIQEHFNYMSDCILLEMLYRGIE